MVNGMRKIEGGLRTQGHVKHRNCFISPLITIITATFNAEKQLEPCILSVLQQNYRPFELIIIDGGSTDRTLNIIRKYEDRIDYWLSEPDRGVYDAFNKGIDLAHGDWLFFLGADDRLADENVLKRFFSKACNAKLLYGNVRWGETGRIHNGKFPRLKFFRSNVCQQAIFYHRDLFERLGKFDLKYSLVADWAFNMKAFATKEAKPLFIDTVVADYCTEGMSTNVEDESFSRDRERLFRACFGSFALFRAKLSHFFEKLISLFGESK